MGAFLLIFVLGLISPIVLQKILIIFGSTPIDFWRIIVFSGVSTFSSAGWPLLIMGFLLAVLCAPFQMSIFVYSQFFKDYTARRDYRKTAPEILNAGWILFIFVMVVAIASLWIFLNGPMLPPSMRFLSIDNIAQRGWGYLSNVVIYVLASLLFGFVFWISKVQYDLESGVGAFLGDDVNPFFILIACFVITALVPVGVLLLIIGVAAGLGVVYASLNQIG